MKPLYMIHMPCNVEELRRWSSKRGLGKHGYDEGLALHKIIGETFGKEHGIRPFCLKVAPRSRKASFYGYADVDASTLQQNAMETAPPEHCSVFNLPRDDAIQSKEMPTQWKVGKCLGFETKLLPIRRSRNCSENGKVTEIDCYSWAKKYGDTRSLEEVYLEWVKEKVESTGGMEIVTKDNNQQWELDISSLRQVVINRRKNDTRMLKRREIVVRGKIRITDSDKFNAALKTGIGRHLSYGYGMLLLRPL